MSVSINALMTLPIRWQSTQEPSLRHCRTKALLI